MPSATIGANDHEVGRAPSSVAFSSPSSSSYFGARDMATRRARMASSATPSSSGTPGMLMSGSLTSTAGSLGLGSVGILGIIL